MTPIRLRAPARFSGTRSAYSYQSLDATSLTIGGGSAKIKVGAATMVLSVGNAHLDINASYIALVYGSSYVKVDSTGIHHVGNVDK